jgi:hypothetical protein
MTLADLRRGSRCRLVPKLFQAVGPTIISPGDRIRVWFATGTGFSRVPPFLEIGRVNAHDAGLQPAGGTNLDSMSSNGLCCDHPNMMAEILSSVGN